jgi:transcriptional regulator with XRE-family HTH domain
VTEIVLEKLRDLLRQAKITQADLGKHLDLSQNAVSCLLRGQTKLTLEMFLQICNLLGLRPQELMVSAEAAMAKKFVLEQKHIDLIYSSPAHLIACNAATREVSAQELAVGAITIEEAEGALEDLTAAGLLSKKGKFYIQTYPNAIYSTGEQTLVKEKCHRQVVNQSWESYEILRQNPEYRKKRFNAAILERLTDSQREEIKNLMFRVYDRTQSFVKENMLKSYQTDEDMPLVNVHLMMVTPLETDEL